MAIGIRFGAASAGVAGSSADVAGSSAGVTGSAAGVAGGPLFGQSKWWGFPDMPEDLEYPEVPVREEYVDDAGHDAVDEYDDPLTFICQIRCADLAAVDPEGLLPHEGMLYFFAALDYFLGDLDAAVSPGLGEWEAPCFKVLWAPSCENLHTHSILYEDGTEACLPAVPMTFVGGCGSCGAVGDSCGAAEDACDAARCSDGAAENASGLAADYPGAIGDGFQLLGRPFYDEVVQEMPGMINLLQIDENDDWGLRFFDCGMLNFLISPADLSARRWSAVKCYLTSA